MREYKVIYTETQCCSNLVLIEPPFLRGVVTLTPIGALCVRRVVSQTVTWMDARQMSDTLPG